MAHVIFSRYSPVNNALSPFRTDARDAVGFRQSHVIRSLPIKRMEKKTFDDWYLRITALLECVIGIYKHEFTNKKQEI